MTAYRHSLDLPDLDLNLNINHLLVEARIQRLRDQAVFASNDPRYQNRQSTGFTNFLANPGVPIRVSFRDYLCGLSNEELLSQYDLLNDYSFLDGFDENNFQLRFEWHLMQAKHSLGLENLNDSELDCDDPSHQRIFQLISRESRLLSGIYHLLVSPLTSNKVRSDVESLRPFYERRLEW